MISLKIITFNRVLEFFNASPSDYDVIFTSGATDSIKLIGESFSENDIQVFAYTQENHTSVLGLRRTFSKKGAKLKCFEAKELFCMAVKDRNSSTTQYNQCALFAYPAECNYSGSKYPLDWIQQVHSGSLDFIHPGL